MKRSVAVCLIAAAALAQGERVTFQFQDESLEKVVDVLKTLGGIPLTLDDELKGRTVTLDLKNVLVEDAVDRLAAAAGARRRGDAILPEWKDNLLEELKKTKLHNLKLAQAPLKDVAAYLRSVTGANFVVDGPLADRKIDLVVDDITVGQALDLAFGAHAAWDLRWGVVYVATKPRLEELPAQVPLAGAKLPDRRIDLPFQNTPLPQVVSYLTAATGVTLAVQAADKDALEAMEVTAAASGLTIPQALALVLLPNGATTEVKDGAIAIRTRRER